MAMAKATARILNWRRPSFDRRTFDRTARSTAACSTAPYVRSHRPGTTELRPVDRASPGRERTGGGAPIETRGPVPRGKSALTRSPHPAGELAPHPAGRQVPVVENVLADRVVVQD